MKDRPTQASVNNTARFHFKPRRKVVMILQSGKYRIQLGSRPVFPHFAESLSFSPDGEWQDTE